MFPRLADEVGRSAGVDLHAAQVRRWSGPVGGRADVIAQNLVPGGVLAPDTHATLGIVGNEVAGAGHAAADGVARSVIDEHAVEEIPPVSDLIPEADGISLHHVARRGLAGNQDAVVLTRNNDIAACLSR